jgi:hypothetical protein
MILKMNKFASDYLSMWHKNHFNNYVIYYHDYKNFNQRLKNKVINLTNLI